MLAVAEVAAIGVAEATAAALSQFEELGAVLSLCAAGATAIGVGPIAATAAYRGYGVGAAAVGAAAVGAAAAGAYRGSCYDAYGNYVCAGGYRPY